MFFQQITYYLNPDQNPDTIDQIDLSGMTIENFDEILPVNNPDLYISKIYRKLITMEENPQLLEQIEDEICRAEKCLDSAFEEAPPEEFQHLRQLLIEAFQNICEGLIYFRNFVIGDDDENLDEYLLNAFYLIYLGDLAILEIENEFRKENEKPILELIA